MKFQWKSPTEAAIADSQEHVQGPSIEEPLKVLIKGDISSGAASRGQQEEPSREDEVRKEDQTSRVSVEEPSKEDPKENAASAGDQGKKLGPKKVKRRRQGRIRHKKGNGRLGGKRREKGEQQRVVLVTRGMCLRY